MCGDLCISIRTYQRWKIDPHEDRRSGAAKHVYGKLSPLEEDKVIEVCNSLEYRNLTPWEIHPKLLEKGLWIASARTFYHVLKRRNQLKWRSRARQPGPRSCKNTLKVTGPGQLWSWDITYLKTDIRGVFYYLYLFMDVWSRKIIAAYVSSSESSQEAAALMNLLDQHYSCRGVRLHSDNGAPMKGGTMLMTLHTLGVIPSFSRPRVSEDNPYSEALFRTMKYTHRYPGHFTSLPAARAWVEHFVEWYNNEHLHSPIGYVTPNQRHSGADLAILATRQQTLDAARASLPHRWKGRLQARLMPGRTLSFTLHRRSA